MIYIITTRVEVETIEEAEALVIALTDAAPTGTTQFQEYWEPGQTGTQAVSRAQAALLQAQENEDEANNG